MIYLANSSGTRLDEEQLWPLPGDKSTRPVGGQNERFFAALDREIERLGEKPPAT